VLRAIGWDVRSRGPTNRLLAALGLPYFALRDRSLTKAAKTFNYLTEDRTRLFPAISFEEIGADLLRLTRGQPARRASAFESLLAEDIEALVFLRVPQLPSSRVWGDSPIVSVDEYTDRVPSDPALAKVIPVPPRPFPEALRDSDLLTTRPRRGQLAVALWGAVTLLAVPWILWRWLRQKGDKEK
jgi:hypothetical protein